MRWANFLWCRIIHPVGKYLIFWTSHARFAVNHEPDSDAPLGLDLADEWQEKQPGELDFIAIAANDVTVHVLLVEWIDGIAERSPGSPR